MCIGIPMQIIENGEGYALCKYRNEKRRVDTMLVGEHPPGTWLLIFLDAAREVLSPESATQISNALQALELSLQGEANIDHLFQDLIDREPELPEFLRSSNLDHTKGN